MGLITVPPIDPILLSVKVGEIKSSSVKPPVFAFWMIYVSCMNNTRSRSLAMRSSQSIL